MSTQKNLITLGAAAVFALGLAACGGGSKTTTPKDPDPDLTLAGVRMAQAVPAGTYRISDDLAEALEEADDGLLGVDHAEGATIEVAGLMLACGAGPCRVTVNDDGTITTTGTIWTAGYMPPPRRWPTSRRCSRPPRRPATTPPWPPRTPWTRRRPRRRAP